MEHRKGLQALVGRRKFLSAYELRSLARLRMTDATLSRRLREDKVDGLVEVRYVGKRGVAVYRATRQAAKWLRRLEGKKK